MDAGAQTGNQRVETWVFPAGQQQVCWWGLAKSLVAGFPVGMLLAYNNSNQLAFMQHLPCARPSSKLFMHPDSFTLYRPYDYYYPCLTDKEMENPGEDEPQEVAQITSRGCKGLNMGQCFQMAALTPQACISPLL